MQPVYITRLIPAWPTINDLTGFSAAAFSSCTPTNNLNYIYDCIKFSPLFSGHINKVSDSVKCQAYVTLLNANGLTVLICEHRIQCQESI